MTINLKCCLFVLDNIKNDNNRKTDIKKLKLLVNDNNTLINFSLDKNYCLKDTIRNNISSIIESNNFHLEQVYTLGEPKYYDKGIDIIYLGITNIENIKKLNDNYKLIDFEIKDKKEIILDNISIKYSTKLKKINNNLEYIHDIKTDDINLEKELIELITSYKQIVSKLDYTDIVFKFLPKYFTLEDVRIVYEMLKNIKVDKSNFRKKIMKYCKQTDKVLDSKGYRPTHIYEFKLDENDIWM